MKYQFDREIDREGTSSVKWEFVQEGKRMVQRGPGDQCFGQNRILPLWVADMDFPSPEPVVRALVKRAQHGIYGYTAPTDAYFASVVRWMRRRHNWEIRPEWVCVTPGVVPALDMLVHTFAAQGEKVLIQPPVYHPFFSAVENNSAEVVANPLVYASGRYGMDFADLEEKIRDAKVRLAILCNPHNPVGRVWTREELARFGEICLRHNVLIVSDEIHGDIIHKGHVFTPLATVSEALAQNSITCTAPSKTFNLAGLQTSNIIVPSEALRTSFQKTLLTHGMTGTGAFGVVALQAAYDQGEEWLDQVLEYLGDNLRFLEDYVAKHIPQVGVVQPEGTYLVWLDFSRLGIDKLELRNLLLHQARVYLDDGFIFGPQGEGFMRINIGCPRSILQEALQRIRRAVLGAAAHSP
ncbi:MAG: MalY/PatB family protein [Anaerolineales bacterium]|jgi:cystathionine beta-lyase